MMINVGNRIINNWLYAIDGGYVLIDTGYEGGFERLSQELRRKDIALSEIKYLFLTHAHDDHAGFLNEILTATDTMQVVMHHAALDRLYIGQNSFVGGCSTYQAYLFCQLMKLFGKGQHRFPPLRKEFESRCILITSENIQQIEQALCGRILFTPGHTYDSISLLNSDNCLFCGDAAMNGFPSKRNVTIWLESKDDFQHSWNIIIKNKPALIYPAHGKPFHTKNLTNNLTYLEHIKLYSL